VCVRQRLSSEPDRYRGRRRVPTPPRSRYAAVVTSAFLGAGVVALGSTMLPDAKAVDQEALADLRSAAATGVDQEARAAEVADQVSRDADRSGMETTLADTADVWALPMTDYTFTNPYGMEGAELHAGIDLAAAEGTPFAAVHSGTVKSAGWGGGYGLMVVIDHGNGIETVYGHARQLLVKAGDKVQAGQPIGLVGATGHAYGSQLCLEVQVDGESRDPVRYLIEHGVDIKLQVASIYS
jgi:murein DD-endopeptidase MepM/ murein hydrolase activator NlpD